MTVTVTDLFCGAGGSSHGAEQVPGTQIVMAANHWDVAIDVHQTHFPHARHDCADISQADPRRYPPTSLLLASPECTNHSQARGVSRRKQHRSLFDGDFDPAAERSRATMWDVGRFAEQIRYDAIVVLSVNSMHHGVPQSRDRIYVVFWRSGLRPELEPETEGWCGHCEQVGAVRQAWKPGRAVGRYRRQWFWAHTACGQEAAVGAPPASSIIDWGLPCPPIGSRTRPLAPATRARIAAGLAKYGWQPVTTAGAGHVWEGTPGSRARGGRLVPVDAPHPTVCSSDDRHSLIVPLRNHGQPTPVTAPVRTVAAAGQHHSLLVQYNRGTPARPVDQPVPTVTTRDRCGLLNVEQAIDDCGFRMLEPYEIAAAMGFPDRYIPTTLPKKDQVRLAGNAVTPPTMTWIVNRLVKALEAA